METTALICTSDPSESSQNSSGVVDRSVELANTVITIVKEVGEMLNSVPYVKSLSGVILQIIKIRDEIKTNKKRCSEIIDKVLRMSKSIYEKLAEVARSHQRDNLSRLEGHLREHEKTLTSVYIALDKHRSRSRFSQLLNRGLDELNEHDRLLDELNTHLILDIIFHITMEQAAFTSIPNQLPPSASTFTSLDADLPPKPFLMVERDSQQTIALEILLKPEPSRIAILGGGGFGKTTLARSILHHPTIIERYSSRYFLSCESTPDVDSLLLGLGNMLRIKVAPSAIFAAIRHALRDCIALLCLDNFETPWEPFGTRTKVEELLESIAGIPNLSLMITLRGEQRPSKIAWSTPLLPSLSTLSLDGAKTTLQNITGIHTIDEPILKLLQAIDGIPLAVTLISTLLRDGESPESLWRRWMNGSTQILHTGGDDRQSSLNRSISLSVFSLRMNTNTDADASRVFLAALSLFPDGFPADEISLDGLQKHLNASSHSIIQRLQNAVKRPAKSHHRANSDPTAPLSKRGKILDIHAVLQTLRTVALVKIDETGTSRRMHLLSPIRLYCHQFLSSEIAFVENKILGYCIDLLLEVTDDVTNSEYYARIVPEIKNIHSLFQRAFTFHNPKDLDLPKLIDATIYLTEWSWYTGYYSRDTLQVALSKATRDSHLHARCILSIGDLYQREAELEDAEKCFRVAARLFKRCRDAIGEANALQYLGNVLYTMRQLDDAEAVLKSSLELYTKTSDKEGEAGGRFRLGQLYADKCQYSEAEANLTTALEVYKEVSDLLGQANAAQNLSRLHIALGNLSKAEELAQKSLKAAKQAKYALGEGNALRLLGHIYRLTDKMIDARQALEQALDLQKQQNNPVGQLNAINGLAQAYIQLDLHAMAEKMLTDSVKEGLEVIQVPDVLTTLGWLYICGNQLEKAEKVLDKALELFQRFDDKSWQAEVLAHLGNVYFRSDRLEDAERILKSIPESGAPEDINMYRLWVLGDLYCVENRIEDSEKVLNLAMDAAKWCRSSYQQGNILRSLGSIELKRGNTDLAIDKFTEALEHHRKAQWVSEQAADLQKLGEAYELLARSQEKITVLNEVEKLTLLVHKTRGLP